MSQHTTEDWVIKEYLPTLQGGEPNLSWEDVLKLREEKVTLVTSPSEVNRRYLDPPIEGQRYGLLSFIPAQGATPNQKGFYGYVKLRGNYATEREVVARENEVIQKVDSLNHVFTCIVGHPIPLVVEGYSKVKTPIEVSKAVNEDVSAHIRAKADDIKAQIQDMKDTEKELRREAEEGPDPLDVYTTLRNKLAIHRWMLKEHERKVAELVQHRDRCVISLIKSLSEHPEYEDLYLKRYLETRAQKGFRDEDVSAGDITSMSFIKHPIIWDEERIDLSEVAHLVASTKAKAMLTRIQDQDMLLNILKEEKRTLVMVDYEDDPDLDTLRDVTKVVAVRSQDCPSFIQDHDLTPPCVVLFGSDHKVGVYPESGDLRQWVCDRLNLHMVDHILSTSEDPACPVDTERLEQILKDKKYTLLRVDVSPDHEGPKSTLMSGDIGDRSVTVISVYSQDCSAFVQDHDLKPPCVVLFRSNEKVDVYPGTGDLEQWTRQCMSCQDES